MTSPTRMAGVAEPLIRSPRALPLVTISPSPARLEPAERARLQRRARLLAWGGNAWHVAEFAIALVAGIAAGSIALIGFGIDSLIEVLAGVVVVWLFTGSRIGSHAAERFFVWRAQCVRICPCGQGRLWQLPPQRR